MTHLESVPPPMDEPPLDGPVPPQDLTSEAVVLGSLMLNANAIDDVLDLVIGPDFYRPAHETIFDAITFLHMDGQRVDLLTVSDELTRRGSLARVGGASYVADLPNRVGFASPVHAAKIVRERAVQRRLIEVGSRITQAAYTEGDLDAKIADAQTMVDGIDAGRLTELRSAVDVLPTIRAEMEQPTRLANLPWPSLNRAMRGLAPGRVYVIGARPGAGKSAMALGIARWWLQHHRQPVAFSSLEMSSVEVTERLIAQISGVPFSVLDEGTLTETQQGLFDRAEETLRSLPPIWVDDRESVDPSHVRSHARQAKRRGGLGLVVVDYLQLMESPKQGENRNQEVARFSRAMKKLARSMEVPVVVLSQLNRGSEHRGVESAPRLSDLRDSGAVEQDADVVMLLHRPNVDSDEVTVGMAKNRQGPKGNVSLYFDGPLMEFRENAYTPTNLGGGR